MIFSKMIGRLGLFPLILGASVSAVPAAFADDLPSDLSTDCLAFIDQLRADKAEFGFIQAPEDWNHPEGSPKLHIFYFGANPEALGGNGSTPIVYFNGGPGGTPHHAYTVFKTFPAAAGIPFLYIDQRGNGCSSPYPTVSTNLAGAVRLGRYGSRNIVHDAEAIRHTIFPDGRRWSVFGQSFGAAIVHRYIAIAPGALKKAFLQGDSLMNDGIAWSEDRMLSQKRIGDLYLNQFPEDEKIFASARAQLPADYCTGDGTSVTCGPALLDQFIGQSLAFPRNWASIHTTLGQMLTADGKLDPAFLAANLPATIDPNPSQGEFMVAVIPGRELPGGLLNTWSCQLAVPRLIDRGLDPSSWFYNECRGDLATRSTYDSFLKRIIEKDYLTIAQVANGLRDFPKLEMHLYSGELDSVAPREGFREEVARLGRRIYYSNIANIGHDWTNAPQIWADLRRP